MRKNIARDMLSAVINKAIADGAPVIAARDYVRCTNAEPGTFNHECGRPAVKVGRHASGHKQAFCARCAVDGFEARGCKAWSDLPAGASSIEEAAL